MGLLSVFPTKVLEKEPPRYKRLETIMKNKKLIGIILAILFLLLLYYTSPLINNNFDGALGYMMKSVQRILFFAVELIIFVKLFKKDSMRSIVNMNCFKDAVPACSAMFIYVVFDVITYVVIGAKSWLNTTMPIVVSCLIFMQLATGLWEELTFRAFVCEGYYQGANATFKRRLLYAGISMVIFGIAHAVECDSLEQAIYRFIMTGVWGFAFSSVYLYTHNILVAAFIHFFTDIFLNIHIFISDWNDSPLFIILDNYVQWVMLAIILIVAIVFLYKKPVRE